MSETRFIDIVHRGRVLGIEYVWLNDAPSQSPVLVFLHEGLGSVAMWRDFPARLCAAIGCRGLVYSRPGYGRSTPKPPGERWEPDYLAIQAVELLPAFLDAVGLDARQQRLYLFGHSDGGTIALIHAAQVGAALAGIVVMAPHIKVEPISIAGIEQACAAYDSGDFRARLARFHDDVDSAFRGWSEAWLDPRFRTWSIEADLPAIRCPVLAIQGERDEYGTMAQIDGIAASVSTCTRVKLAGCGHQPHREQPQAVIDAVCHWLPAPPR